MLLNRVEKAMMNNPVREAVQRQYEMRKLRAMGGRVDGARCLEIGCGRGVGVEIVLDRFGAEHVDGIDLDPDMIARARLRLASRGASVNLWVGSATQIDAGDEAYDAVFDFGIIHHIPEWRDALREVHRVLRPGGRFFAEEVFAKFILHPVWRRLLVHPLEDRFDRAGFERALDDAGFRLLASDDLLGDFGFFVAERV